VANMLEEELEVSLKFVDSEGFPLAESTTLFPPLSQRHFPTLGLLDEELNGYVAITPNKPDSIVAQSVFYHRSYRNRSIETAYASPAREPFGRTMYTTYNMFLGMQNMMRVMNLGSSEVTVTYTLSGPKKTVSPPIDVAPQHSLSWQLNPSNFSSGEVNSYGIVTVESSIAGAIASEIVRIKQLTSGKYEFAIDTPAK